MKAKASKTKQNKPPGRGLYTAETVQNEVVRQRLKGGKIQAIAQQLGVCRDTVRRILDKHEVAERVGRARSVLLESAEKMAERYTRIGLKGRPQHAAPVIGKTLEGLQVLVPRRQEELGLMPDPMANRERDELDYFALTGFWPSAEEREYRKVHGKWPHQEAQHN